MALATIHNVPTARPVVEIGVGDSRGGGAGGLWGRSTAPAITNALWGRTAAPPIVHDRWNGYQPTWIDVSCDTIEVQTFTGHERTSDQWEVGTATIVLANSTGWADFPPLDPDSFLVVRPGRPVRVRMVLNDVAPFILWRGYIDEANPGYDAEEGAIVTLECIDAKGEAGRGDVAQLAAPIGAGTFVHQRLNDILTRQAWPSYWRNIDTSSIKVIASDYGFGSADLLNRTADSGGGAIFGDVEGKVAFRNRDWQMWNVGAPPDGTIGNSNQVIGTIPATPGYVTFSGAPFNGLFTLSTTALNVGSYANAGDFCVVARIAPDTWTGPAGTIVAKHTNTAGHRSWMLQTNPAGTLQLTWSADGSTVLSASSINPVPAVAGQWLWVGFTFDVNDAAGHRVLRYWTSPDGSAWTQLGPTQTTTGTTTIFVNTDPLTIGGQGDGTTQPFAGDIEHISLRTGFGAGGTIGGTEVFRLDGFNYVSATASSVLSSSGHTVAINRDGASPTTVTPFVPASSVIVDDYCPTNWEMSFARADFVNRVLVANSTMTAPIVVEDTPNVVLYGVDTTPFDMTDLDTQDTAELTQLGTRLLATRGYGTYDPTNPDARSYAPRIAGVTLDAATADNIPELLATADPRTPSRYVCRHWNNNRWEFQRTMFCTAISHTINPDGWQARLSLDDATPWQIGASTGRWTTTGRWGRTTPQLTLSTWASLPGP
jgi:hypothetical protein